MSRFQKILIVGARSKLTRPLIEQLSLNTKQIILHSRNSLSDTFDANVFCCNGDFSSCADVISTCDAIIYLAGVAGYGPHQAKDWSFFYDNNVTPLINILSLISPEKLQKFIYVSSTDVFDYGFEKIIDEHTMPTPKNLYGLSKYLAEMCLMSFFKTRTSDYSIIRPGPIYGGRDKNRFGLAKVFADLAAHKSVDVFNPSSELGLMSVNEVSEAIAALLHRNIEIVNLVGSHASLRETINHFCSIVNSKSDIKWHKDIAPLKLNFDRQLTQTLLGRKPDIVFAPAALELQKYVQGEGSDI